MRNGFIGASLQTRGGEKLREAYAHGLLYSTKPKESHLQKSVK